MPQITPIRFSVICRFWPGLVLEAEPYFCLELPGEAVVRAAFAQDLSKVIGTEAGNRTCCLPNRSETDRILGPLVVQHIRAIDA